MRIAIPEKMKLPMAKSSPVPIQSAEPVGGLRLWVVLAFFAIYILWGTTYLAIRVVVGEMPPLFAAGVRFTVAGAALFGFMRMRSVEGPSRRQWRNLLAISLLMFVVDYGALFWAEKYVPSGIAAVLLATIPIFTLALEMFVLGKQPFRWAVAVATLLGFAGVGVLLLPGAHGGLAMLPCAAILVGSLSWSVGTVMSRGMDLPASRPVTSGATMLLGGVILLAVSGAVGEMRALTHVSFHTVLAELYLIVFGSLVAYTAFVWLLARMPATRVSSYAYVNPIVAVALGYFAGGESISVHALMGAALVVVSVFLILRAGK